MRVRSLSLRLVVAYLVPALALGALLVAISLHVAESSLDRSLDRRLTAIAAATAAQINPAAVEFLAPGDESSRTARRLRTRLLQLKQQTDIARIVVLDKSLRIRLDTDARTKIGDRHYKAEADRTELERVFAGRAASSILFSGRDGKLYKTGYAPLLGEKGVSAAVGVEGNAHFFSDLRRLRRYLATASGIVAAFIIIVSLLIARRITRPLRSLADEARRIGAGDLTHPINSPSRDEVGELAVTMEIMRRELADRDQQLQMMLAGIAHEVRNPLGGIALFAGLLRSELADRAESLKMVERIEGELEYLKKVVGDFLDFARRRAPDLSPVPLKALLDELAEMFQPQAAANNLRFSRELEQLTVAADGEQLRRLVLNLLENARQATAPGGMIALRCFAENDRAVIEVEDDGEGIEPEVQARMFEPFYTTREKGTGLGLALSRKIVEQHGGRISLTSTPSGTRFRVTLPLGTKSPA